MFSKNIDHMLVGKNYLSLIAGLIALDQSKSCLLLDDPNFQLYGPDKLIINQLQVELLREVGKHYQLPPLHNIDHFISPHQVELVTDKFHLLLGRKCSDNLQELERQLFPLAKANKKLNFTPVEDYQSIERTYHEIAHLTARKLLESIEKGEHNFSKVSHLLANSNLPFGHQINHLKKIIQVDGTDWMDNFSLASTIQLFSSALLGMPMEQSDITDEVSSLYAYSLISPLYFLDTKKLDQSLLHQFIQAGGIYKQSTIQGSAIHQQRVWAVELKSFDGIYNPDQLHLFDSNLDQTPFSLHQSPLSYDSIVIENKYDYCDFLSLEGKTFVIGANESDTGKYPIATIGFSGKKITVICYQPYQKCRKVAFVQDEITTWVDHIIWDRWGIGPSSLTSRDIRKARNVVPSHPKADDWDCNVVEISPENQTISDVLNNCHYLGPLTVSNQGNLSLIINSLLLTGNN